MFAGYNARFDMDFVRALFEKSGDSYFGSWFYSAPLDVMSFVAEAVHSFQPRCYGGYPCHKEVVRKTESFMRKGVRMSRYAEKTSVSVEKSKAEIDKILQRYGASQFISGWDQEMAYIGFYMADRMVKFVLPLPPKDSDEFIRTPGRRTKRTHEKALAAWEQACRQRWRALSLVIKAKLEAVETGITSFEDEFLAHIMLPDGRTAGEFLKPQLDVAYQQKKMPKLLPWGN